MYLNKLLVKKNKLFNQIYSIDASTNRYMIEVGLDQYSDVFSEWDPAPFKRRSLDPDLELYLESSCDEIPNHHPIELMFILHDQPSNQEVEEQTRVGLANSFSFKLYLINKELGRINAQMARYVVFGLVLLWVASRSLPSVEEGSIPAVLVEGLFISGWVFLWEAVSLFCFTNLELYHRHRIYKRLKNAPVFFKNANHQTFPQSE